MLICTRELQVRAGETLEDCERRVKWWALQAIHFEDRSGHMKVPKDLPLDQIPSIQELDAAVLDASSAQMYTEAADACA